MGCDGSPRPAASGERLPLSPPVPSSRGPPKTAAERSGAAGIVPQRHHYSTLSCRVLRLAKARSPAEILHAHDFSLPFAGASHCSPQPLRIRRGSEQVLRIVTARSTVVSAEPQAQVPHRAPRRGGERFGPGSTGVDNVLRHGAAYLRSGVAYLSSGTPIHRRRFVHTGQHFVLCRGAPSIHVHRSRRETSHRDSPVFIVPRDSVPLRASAPPREIAVSPSVAHDCRGSAADPLLKRNR